MMTPEVDDILSESESDFNSGPSPPFNTQYRHKGGWIDLVGHRFSLKMQKAKSGKVKLEWISLVSSAVIISYQLYLVIVTMTELLDSLKGGHEGQPKVVGIDVSMVVHAIITILGCITVDFLIVAKMMSMSSWSIKTLTNSYQSFAGNKLLEIIINMFNILPFTFLNTIILYLMNKYAAKEVLVRLEVEFTTNDVFEFLLDDVLRISICFVLVRYWFVISCNALLRE